MPFQLTKSCGALLVMLVPMCATALEGSWHIGLGAGVSSLSPDVEGSGFTLEDKQSTAISLNIGIDVLPTVTAEVGFTDLGEASLSGGQTVDYQALSLGAVAYVLGQRETVSRQDGLSAYLRVGVNSIDNDSKLNLVESNNTALWLGAGVQWPLTQSLGLRGEITSYDGDAQTLMASIIWRTDGIGPKPLTPETQPEATVESAENTSQSKQTDANSEASPATAGLETPDFECPAAAATKISDASDCQSLNSVVERLKFFTGSDRITLAGNSALDKVAQVLKRYPDVIVEIRVHTQRFTNPDLASTLARQRAIAVARYLVSMGIPIEQLRARSFGDSLPLDSNKTPKGRRNNNRVELRVL